MTDVNDMLLFAAVVREGGYTAAARAVGLTKQSVSERMSRFERALGVQLLVRTTRVVRPTEAGAAYYARVASIAAQIEDANREVQRRQAEPTGLLRVSAPVLYGRRFLGPVVAEYLRRHPRVRVDLSLADRMVDLVGEGYDLAIRVGELPDSSLVARLLGTASIHYVASPGYLKKHGVPRRAEDLRDARVVCMRSNESWRVGAHEVKVAPVLVVNDLEAACEAAIRGVGIARVTSLVCAEALRARTLKTLFDDAPPVRRRVHVLHQAWPSPQGGNTASSKVRLFIEALAAAAPGLEPPEGAASSRAVRDG